MGCCSSNLPVDESKRPNPHKQLAIESTKFVLVPRAVLVGSNITSKCAIISNESLCILAGDNNDVIGWEPDSETFSKENITSVPVSEYKLIGHKGAIYSISWSPDGKQIATSSHDHSICFWDAYGFESDGGDEICISCCFVIVTFHFIYIRSRSRKRKF